MHARLVPYYNTFVGKGYRLDHLPLAIFQSTGSEGFMLHGGPLTEAGEPDFFLSYGVHHGRWDVRVGVGVGVGAGQGQGCMEIPSV